MFGDIFGKLQEMQAKVAQAKEQLDTISVSGQSPDGRVKVVASGNRKITDISIDDELRTGDREELEDLLVIALNQALEKAENVHQSTMSAATGDVLPPHLMNLMNANR